MRRDRQTQKSDRSREGQALVEFALVLPLLLLLVIGVFEFGRAWNAYQVITDAAREGARTAVVADPAITSDSVVATVKGALLRAALEPDSATITLEGIDDATGSPARVSIDYPYRFVFLAPLLNWVTDQSAIMLRTATVMRNE